MWAKLKQQIWQWRGVLIAAPSVAGLLIGLRLAGLLQGLELAALDQFFRLRPKELVDPRIVIVGINEADVQKAGQWPMSDATLAKLLERLKQQQPRAIGLDIYRDLPVEPGHVDDSQQKNKNYKKYKLGKAVFTPFNANDGGYFFADVGGYQILSNFRNLRQGFRTISMNDVLEGRMPSDLVRDASGAALAGRIVLIGVTGESLRDSFYTPYSRGRAGQAATSFAGVEIHADVVSQILSAALDGRPLIKVWSEPIEWLWIFGWSVLGATLSWMQRYRGGVSQRSPLRAVSIFVAGGSLIYGSYLAFLQGWWIPVIPPVLAMSGAAIAISSYVVHMATGMRQTFGRYLTDEVVANLLETPDGLQFGGEKRKVTILMSDLRGFSALSERVSPEIAVEVINFYLEVMTEVISQYQGTINEILILISHQRLLTTPTRGSKEW